MNKKPLVFSHIEDLHITKAQDPNYLDFLAIVAQLEAECREQLDFVVLPGDNAGCWKASPKPATTVKVELLISNDLISLIYYLFEDHNRQISIYFKCIGNTFMG
jgi:hypothetical protein